MKEINGLSKVFFGTRRTDGKRIYLSKPSWDCNWYWGFGYLGNSQEHYHLSGYANHRNINMHDALLSDYELNEKIKENLWSFCELFSTAYKLKEAAEVLGRGGSLYTCNSCKSLIINKEEAKRINEVVLPAIFNEINKIIE
jgi:hypothetical protein